MTVVAEVGTGTEGTNYERCWMNMVAMVGTVVVGGGRARGTSGDIMNDVG